MGGENGPEQLGSQTVICVKTTKQLHRYEQTLFQKGMQEVQARSGQVILFGAPEGGGWCGG